MSPFWEKSQFVHTLTDQNPGTRYEYFLSPGFRSVKVQTETFLRKDSRNFKNSLYLGFLWIPSKPGGQNWKVPFFWCSRLLKNGLSNLNKKYILTQKTVERNVSFDLIQIVVLIVPLALCANLEYSNVLLGSKTLKIIMELFHHKIMELMLGIGIYFGSNLNFQGKCILTQW